jgi:hypothetical protein
MRTFMSDLPDEWIVWMQDYAGACRRFTEEEPTTVSTDEAREIVAIRSALYARALTLFEGALLPLENDRQLDFRIHARTVIKSTMYLIALDGDPRIRAKMHEDDTKRRRALANFHFSSGAYEEEPDSMLALREFIAECDKGAKHI